MRDEVAQVLDGRRPWWAEASECLAFLRALPEGCADLVFFSPPYTGARLYLENGADLGIARDAEQWAAWMVEVFRECRRVCKGLVACVCDDQTRGFRYGCAPYLLMADLHRAGFNLRRPCVYRRSGIPGSGGPDWFRCDHEPIICVTPPGRLPWSDVTACGHPPKWAPGGACSNRLSDGARVNQWGRCGGHETGGQRGKDGKRQRKSRPSHVMTSKREAAAETDLEGNPVEQPELPVCPNRQGMPNADDTGAARKNVARKSHTKAKPNGTDEQQEYTPPVLANPGTVVQRLYTAEEVAEIVGAASDTIDCTVGGGQMGEGDRFSRANEAPFPESLCERFVLSFCPPGSLVIDPFCGSGTTAAVAVRWNRRALTCDLRPSQVELARKRIAGEAPLALFTDEPGTQEEE